LQEYSEINNGVNYYLENNLDTMISYSSLHRHAFFDNKPLNFALGEALTKTQNLEPIKVLNYALMIWKTQVFMESFENHGHAFFSGKVGYFESLKYSNLIIKDLDDFKIVESILQNNSSNIEYDELISKSRYLDE
jgi:CMP-N-acetylneuraminic acid synthetase